jgi:signal transduction histidine kinase
MMPTQQQNYSRLLLIDDEPGIRRMMALDLGGEGYEVFTAPDGKTGLELFTREKPDLVLTDLKMPGMDGIEVLRRVKRMSPETEVIVITGHGDMDLAIKSLQERASDFITKPINNQALKVALERARWRLHVSRQLQDYTQGLEQKVEEATAKVVAAERLAAVGQAVSVLAHSIKNMLGGLKGGTYMVEEGLNSKREEIIGQGLSMIKRNLLRVGGLVSDLLTLAKPRQPELEPVHLYEIVQEAVQTMLVEAEAKEVGLELAPGPDGLVILADKKAILDAALNLISNALDAAQLVSKGAVKVEVEQAGPEAVVTVTDNGPGLDQEAKDHIFKEFFSTKGAAGTGLGLMVTRKIAEEHQGRVDFESEPGQGAVFRLSLPAKGA